MIQAGFDRAWNARRRVLQSQRADCCYSNRRDVQARAAPARRYSPRLDRALARVAATQPWTRRTPNLIFDRPVATARAARTECHATRRSPDQSVQAGRKWPAPAYPRSIEPTHCALMPGPDEI